MSAANDALGGGFPQRSESPHGARRETHATTRAVPFLADRYPLWGFEALFFFNYQAFGLGCRVAALRAAEVLRRSSTGETGETVCAAGNALDLRVPRAISKP
jgi:hypothetical protein